MWIDITEKYSILSSQSGLYAYFFSGALVLGMASILLTTTDAVVITAIMFWYDNIAKRNSKMKSHDHREIKKIRRIGRFKNKLKQRVIHLLVVRLLLRIHYGSYKKNIEHLCKGFEHSTILLVLVLV